VPVLPVTRMLMGFSLEVVDNAILMFHEAIR
jgi:hypothetical protein